MLYLGQIKLLCPTRVPLDIVKMEFEMILGVPFFIVILTLSSCVCTYAIHIAEVATLLQLSQWVLGSLNHTAHYPNT